MILPRYAPGREDSPGRGLGVPQGLTGPHLWEEWEESSWPLGSDG